MFESENIQYPIPKLDYKVLVRCFTYNHSKYIEDALNGFAMQQTNFPFICCVLDDASTDGEQEILKRWINIHCNASDIETHFRPLTTIIIANDKENKNCIYAFHLQKVNIYGKPEKEEMVQYWERQAKYIAICEGDDYWTDPLKLQKQYDILESDPTISLCHHDFLIQKDGIFSSRNIYIPSRQDIVSVAEFNFPQTLTMFYRNIGEPLVPAEFSKNRLVYQFFWNVRLAEYGDIYYLNEKMGVYRQQLSGVYSQNEDYYKTRMALINNDNMIEWFTNWHPNEEVIKALKRRARKMVVNMILSRLVRIKIRQSMSLVKIYCKYV